MATHEGTADFILDTLRNPDVFRMRKMFGDYALYADGKVVGLICDDQLFIKILPASASLEDRCEKGIPYVGAKPWYVVDEDTLSGFEELPDILINIADALPKPKKKKARG